MSKDYFSKNTKCHPQRKKKKMLNKLLQRRKPEKHKDPFPLISHQLIFLNSVTEECFCSVTALTYII